MRNEWKKDRLLYWPKFFLDDSSNSFASWLGLLNRGSLRAQSPLSGAGSHFGILSPTNSNRLDTWLYYFLPLFFRLFTQVNHLIDRSVEGQYITFEQSTVDVLFVTAKCKPCEIFRIICDAYEEACFSNKKEDLYKWAKIGFASRKQS